MNGLRCCVGVLVLLSASNVLFAKAITTRIVIEGSGLTSPIAITDPTVLKDFNVWAGRGTYMNGTEGTQGFIIDWVAGTVTERPQALPRYEISFYVKYANPSLEKPEERRAYVVQYEWDATRDQGFVYLPGPSDEWYRLNTSSIHRNGMNGHWFRATREWQDAVRSLLAQAF